MYIGFSLDAIRAARHTHMYSKPSTYGVLKAWCEYTVDIRIIAIEDYIR